MLIHLETYTDDCPWADTDAEVADLDRWQELIEPPHQWRLMDLGPDAPTSWACPWCGDVRRQEVKPDAGICYDRGAQQDPKPCPICAGYARADAEANACPGGCGKSGECRCYAAGYASGKADPDVDRQRAYDAAYWAARMVLSELISSRAEPERTEVARALANDVASDANCRGDLGRAAGTAVAAAFRMAANWEAQDAGTADAFGLDPSERDQSWAGRYDGAV